MSSTQELMPALSLAQVGGQEMEDGMVHDCCCGMTHHPSFMMRHSLGTSVEQLTKSLLFRGALVLLPQMGRQEDLPRLRL